MTAASRTALAVCVLSISSFVATENQAALPVDPLAHLAGRWVGDAIMTPASGPAATFKCIVTYLPRDNAPGIKQTLRCDNGADFKLHASSELVADGEKVSGRWKDRINEVDGTLSGAVTATGFDVKLSGRYFAATMQVAGEGCKQSVKVVPQQSDMFRALDATLSKC